MHGDIQVQAKYNCTPEKLIGVKHYERFRNKLMTKVNQGMFKEHIADLLGEKLEVPLE